MKKQDYLSQATKKIIKRKDKLEVAEELDSHIETKVEFYKSIDYEAEAAEEKAVEDMGSAELVQEDFGSVHNDFYSPVFDIATSVILVALLGAMYYLKGKYIDAEPAMLPLLLSFVFLSFGVMLADVSLTLKRRLLPSSAVSVLKLAAVGTFNYFVFADIARGVNSDFKTLSELFYKAELHSSYSQYNKNAVITALAAFCALCAVGIITALVYEIKAELQIKSRLDNKLRRAGVKAYRFIGVVFLAVALYCGVKCYTDYTYYKNEYIALYNTVFEITEKCRDEKQLAQYIESSELEFEIEKSSDRISSYSYEHNYSSLVIYLDGEEEALDFTDKGDGVSKVQKAISALSELAEQDMKKLKIDEELYNTYIKSSPYCVALTADTSEFRKGFDSPTLRWLELSADDEQAIHSAIPYKAKGDELYNFYRGYVPVQVTASPEYAKYFKENAEFKFMYGSDETKVSETLSAEKITDEQAAFRAKEREILKLVSTDATAYEKIAKKTKTRHTAFPMKESGLYAAMIVGNSYFYMYKSEKKAPVLHVFVSEKGDYFFSYVSDRGYISFYSKYGVFDLVDLESVTEDGDYINSYSDNRLTDSEEYTFRKMLFNGYYFDRLGNCYKSPERVIYYARDGKRYYYYTSTEKTPSKDEYDIKHYYLTDRNGNYYDFRQCYCDSEGYLYIDLSNSFKKGEGELYVSPSGEKYTRAFYTSWDENGKILDYKDTK